MRRAGLSIGAKLILLSTFVSVATLALAAVTLISLQYLGSNGDLEATLAYALLVCVVQRRRRPRGVRVVDRRAAADLDTGRAVDSTSTSWPNAS